MKPREDRFASHRGEEVPAELQRILEDLRSPDDETRAGAVRALCPCKGAGWEVPIFRVVWEMRDDPSPVVRRAVQHDLSENPDWGERGELRRLKARRRRQETQRARTEIDAGGAADALPAPHSLAWRTRRRPRQRKWHYR